MSIGWDVWMEPELRSYKSFTFGSSRILILQCFTVPHIVRVDSGGFRWNVEELQIKEYESGNSRNSRWIPGGFQA
jgi:hypothetical protein